MWTSKNRGCSDRSRLRYRFEGRGMGFGGAALIPLAKRDALCFALRFQGRKRVHNGDENMTDIVAKRLVEHLERAARSTSRPMLSRTPRSRRAQRRRAPRSHDPIVLGPARARNDVDLAALVRRS